MKILQIDIETAPNKVYAWGLYNQNIATNQITEAGYTMCFAAKWYGDGPRKLKFHSVHEDGEKKMLREAWKLLDEADAVVHYNGTKFDIPTLNREFLMLGWEPPSPYHQIDLYRTVKSQFRFASNKLDFVCQELGIGSKVQHKGMSLWHDCMQGDEKAWKEMEKYNKQDVILLEDLYDILLPWIKNHPNHALYADIDRPICPTCGSSSVIKKGTRKTKTQEYQQFKCKACGSWHRDRFTMLDKDKRPFVLVQA